MLYSIYAKHLYFNQQDREGSLRYHMKVAKIPQKSIYRKTSITTLKKHKNKSPMCREIEEFLANLSMKCAIEIKFDWLTNSKQTKTVAYTGNPAGILGLNISLWHHNIASRRRTFKLINLRENILWQSESCFFPSVFIGFHSWETKVKVR